jgi:hypothetical protein
VPQKNNKNPDTKQNLWGNIKVSQSKEQLNQIAFRKIIVSNSM